MTALEQFNTIMESETIDEPIERLRFFISLALTGQDWLDVEQFIDGVSQQLAKREKPDFRQMREMLRAMQAGELTVSRGIEILEMLWEGKWSDDMLPPVRKDLIEEDSTPVEIIDRLKQQLATNESNSSDLPIDSEYLANSMQFGADMVTKYVNVVKQNVLLRERANRLVDNADFQLGGCLSSKSKAKDIPSRACSTVKTRHLASLRDALAATDDLSGLILCYAKPVAWDYEGVELWFHATADEQRASTPLYKARKP